MGNVGVICALTSVVACVVHNPCRLLFCMFTLAIGTAYTIQAEGVEEQRGREYVRRFARRSWPQFWCSMVRHNVLACAADILEGIRAPSSSGQYRRYGGGPQKIDKVGRSKTGRTGRGWEVRICGIPCGCPCGVSAAPTLPVPASYPNSCVSADEWEKHSYCDSGHGGYGGGGKRGQQDKQQRAEKWTLPPKLRAAGEGAGSWGGETMMLTTRSTGVRRPPSPTGPAHRRGGGSEAPTVVGSTLTVGQSSGVLQGTASSDMGGFGSSSGGGGVRGWLGGGSASGRGMIPSVFSTSPIPLDEPRKKSYDATGRSGNNLQHGRSSGDVGGATRRRGSGETAGPSGRGLITMFSTAPVEMDEPRKTLYDMGRAGGGDNKEAGSLKPGGEKGFWAAGKEDERGGEGEVEVEVEGELSRGVASGRGLFTNASYAWGGVAEEEYEERSSAGGATKENSTGGG